MADEIDTDELAEQLRRDVREVQEALDSVARDPGLGGCSRITKEEGGGFTGLRPLNPEQRFPSPLWQVYSQGGSPPVNITLANIVREVYSSTIGPSSHISKFSRPFWSCESIQYHSLLLTGFG